MRECLTVSSLGTLIVEQGIPPEIAGSGITGAPRTLMDPELISTPRLPAGNNSNLSWRERMGDTAFDLESASGTMMVPISAPIPAQASQVCSPLTCYLLGVQRSAASRHLFPACVCSDGQNVERRSPDVWHVI